jgi:paraquat-inducible protein B
VEDRGLRAQLKSGSLITGQLYVSLDYHPSAPKVKIDLAKETPEMPVVPSALADLQDKLGSIVAKIDRMPLEAIGNDIKKDLENLDQTLTSAKKLITNADAQLVPGLKTSVEDLHRTLIAVENAMTNANASFLESNAAAQEELRDALREFTRAARSLRMLMDELERQPSSVIRGKTEPTSGGR